MPEEMSRRPASGIRHLTLPRRIAPAADELVRVARAVLNVALRIVLAPVFALPLLSRAGNGR